MFADEAGDVTETGPKRLALVGQGSVRTRRNKVYCYVPVGFRVTVAESGETLSVFGNGPGCILYVSTASVHVHSLTGDTYRIDVSADADQIDQLTTDGTLFAFGEAADTAVQVFAGPPVLTIRTGIDHRRKSTPAGELFWRPALETAWKPWDGCLEAVGQVEAVWRDASSGILRDRVRFIVLPKSLTISCISVGQFRTKIELNGVTDWHLAASGEGQVATSLSSTSAEVQFSGSPRRRIIVELAKPGANKVKLSIRPRFSAAGFFRAEGKMYGDRSQVMIDDLRGGNCLWGGS